MAPFEILVGALCAFASGSLATTAEQQFPLDASVQNSENTRPNQDAILHALKKADIVPSILPPFIPTLNLTLSWPNATTNLGNTLDPAEVQQIPNITLTTLLPDSSAHTWTPTTNNQSHPPHLPQLVFALTDPDAPSRSNPAWSQICHWISTSYDGYEGLREIMPWKPPGPPPGTGKHRYVFVVMVAVNSTREELDLVKPRDRRHWGFGSEGEGVGRWMQDMGMGVAGANFMYAQNEEQ